MVINLKHGYVQNHWPCIIIPTNIKWTTWIAWKILTQNPLRTDLQKKSKSFQQTELKQLAWLTQLPPNLVLDSRQNGLPMWHSGKEFACRCRRYMRRRFNPWVMKIPWSRKWQPIPVFLPGKFHGQRSLSSYSPWGHKELDMAEHTYKHTLTDITWKVSLV